MQPSVPVKWERPTGLGAVGPCDCSRGQLQLALGLLAEMAVAQTGMNSINTKAARIGMLGMLVER